MEKRQRSQKREHQAERRGHTKGRITPRPKSSNHSKIIAVVVGLALIGGGGTGVVVYFTSNSDSFLPDDICAQLKSGVFVENVTAFDVNICMENECPFDVSVCSQPCPFGYHTGEHGFCPESCECAQKGHFEADIMFDEPDVPRLLKTYGIIEPGDDFSLFSSNADASSKLWEKEPNGRLKIAYDFGFISERVKTMAKTVFKAFSEKTCIDFVPKTGNDKQSIIFITNRGCMSFVGKVSADYKPQEVDLANQCYSFGTVSHELLHFLGFQHEHAHPLRDDYITVFLENVRKDKLHNFQKIKRGNERDLGQEYDKRSCLHYNGYAFSKGREYKVIVDKATDKVIRSQRSEMTESDIAEVNALYCSGSSGTTGSSGSSTTGTGSSGGSTTGTGSSGGSTTGTGSLGGSTTGTGSSGGSTTGTGSLGGSTGYGYKGSTGSTGYTGSTSYGYKGSTGYTGSTSYGYKGSTGSTGYTGSTSYGYKGSTGYTGSTSYGYKGSTGYTGSTSYGYKGSTGYTGSTSYGYKGSTGSTSYGYKGSTGYTGSTSYGYKGSTGYTGSTSYGYKGSTWSTGYTGSTSSGYKGSTWSTGYTGSTSYGYKGSTWSTGYTGSTSYGYKGSTWSTGNTGSSSYSYKGYTGSTGYSYGNYLNYYRKASTWGSWGQWSACWKTCGSAGTKRRYRVCSGQNCVGQSYQTVSCPSVSPCPVSVQWSQWASFGSCSKTCGGGWLLRTRYCPVLGKCGLGKQYTATFCNSQACDGLSSWYSRYSGKPCYSCSGDDPSAHRDDERLANSPAFFSETKLTFPSICPNTIKNTWLVGDFNGDEISDIMCGPTDGGNMKVVLNTYFGLPPNVTFEALTQDCNDATKMSADFDGDGYNDILCKDESEVVIKLQKEFQFVAGFDFTSRFCVASDDKMNVIDSNGDGKSDIMCWHQRKALNGFEVQLGNFLL